MEDINVTRSDFRSNKVLSKVFLIIACSIILLDIIAVISGIFEVSLVSKLKRGIMVSYEKVDANDTRQQIIGILQMISFIPYFILFLVWVNRSNKNLSIFNNGYKDFSSGWAVGWFFVPIANFFKPYQVVKEIWTDSSFIKGEERVSHTPVILWWTAWLISACIGRALVRAISSDTLNSFYIRSIVSVVNDIISVALGICTLWIVLKITGFQNRKYELSNQVQQSTEALV